MPKITLLDDSDRCSELLPQVKRRKPNAGHLDCKSDVLIVSELLPEVNRRKPNAGHLDCKSDVLIVSELLPVGCPDCLRVVA